MWQHWIRQRRKWILIVLAMIGVFALGYGSAILLVANFV